MNAEKEVNEAQSLWGACQALVKAVKAVSLNSSTAAILRPLQPEIGAIIRAAREFSFH